MPRDNYRRIRLYFPKRGDLRFLSHLDLMRAFERAIRRSGLPVRFTEGMNPHVKMSFPTALPLGLESMLESMELSVDEERTVREVCEALAAELPEELRPFAGDVAFTGERWRVGEILYEIRGADADLPAPEEVDALLAREEIPVERKGKQVDLRPLLRALAHRGDRLEVSIVWSDKGTVRPEDLLRALNREPDGYRVVKTGMVFHTSTGETVRRVHGEEHSDQRP